jgi:signal transduction histidine kinase
MTSETSQQTLSDIILNLNAITDLEALLKYIASAVSNLVGSEYAMIFLPHESGKGLNLRAHYSGSGTELPLTHHKDIDSTIPAKVLYSAEPYISEEAIPGFPAKNLIYVPMISRLNVVGVLAVYNVEQALTLTDNTLWLLQQMAAHAAIAIENTRIYVESQTRSFELALIVDVAEAVNSTLSLPRVLSLIGKSMLRALGCNYCEVAIRDSEIRQLVTRSLQRSASWQGNHPLSLSADAYPHLYTQMQSGQVFNLKTQDVDVELRRVVLDNTEQAWFIPLLQGDQVVSLVELTYLDSVSQPLPVESIQTKGRELLGRLQDHEDHRALHTARQISRLTGAAGCRVWLTGHEHFRLVIDDSDLIWSHFPYPVRSLEKYPSLEYILNQSAIRGYARGYADLPHDIQNLLDELQISVLLIVPFVVQDGDLGLMLVGDTNRVYEPSPQEVNLAHALVLQAANAIKNAQLFEDLQNSLEVLRRTQAKLVQTARLSAIGELATAVAHQINNPLTTILGDTELLLSDLSPTDPHWESLQAVHRAGERAHEVVRRLLTMSRHKSSTEEPQLMNINATIYNALALVEGTLYRARIRLDLKLANNLPDAYGLSGQLEDVWLNLILNARDAVRNTRKPRIVVRSRLNKQERCVEVSIEDNGVGLGGVDTRLIFDAFYTTKPADEGTGLGLYICTRIVERCGGKITTGASGRKGAKFTVSLPCG